MKASLFFIASIFLFSCGSSGKFDSDQINTTTFGYYYGNAAPDYSLVFKYDGKRLWVDSCDSYFFNDAKEDGSKYKWILLDSTKQEIIDELICSVPLHYEAVDSVFGLPDRLDQGGIFINLLYRNSRTHLDIDNHDETIPEDLIEVRHKIHVVIENLKNKYSVK